MSKAFTPRTVERLRPHIVELVDDLLDRIPRGEVVDVMEALAYRLPVAVISAMLGVPSSDWPRFREVVGRVTVLLEPVIADDEIGPAFEAQAELEEYFANLVALRRRDPGDDLLSSLIAVEEGTDKLSEMELISTAILLFGAGFETTTNLIGNGLLALLRNPEQLARLRADLGAETPGAEGAAMRSAVEELLRYDSPVQFDGRYVFEAIELGGVPVPAGSQIVTALGAANRDPARFTDPERLDLRRDEGPPMSFAGGIHFCLGAALARAEGQVVFDRLLARFGAIELATYLPPSGTGSRCEVSPSCPWSSRPEPRSAQPSARPKSSSRRTMSSSPNDSPCCTSMKTRSTSPVFSTRWAVPTGMSTESPAPTLTVASPRVTKPAPSTTNQCSERKRCTCRLSRLCGSTTIRFTL